MDIDAERLHAAHAVCQRYARELSFELRLEPTLDRQVALRGADFVINTALAAGHHRLREGWEIARRHGYDFGGSFHVMYDEAFWINFYQLRLFESVIEDALAICPAAWHLLVANPVLAGITHLTRKYPQVKIVGLCHGFSGVYGVAETLGLDPEQITFEIPGVNHFVWLTHFYHKGEDVFPMLDRWIESEAPRYRQAGQPARGLSPKTIDLYRRFGALPIGDTATWSGASWPVWYHSDLATEQGWGERPIDGWKGYFTWVAKNADAFKRVAANPAIKVTEFFPPRVLGEPMVPIIEAVACDIPRVIIGNIGNSSDFVPGIPRDFEVEIPTLVSRRGIQGIQTHGLPAPLLAHILHDRVAPVNLELEAFKTGSRELLLQLIWLDPWTRSEGQARALLDDILALPYHEEMRQHYS
jgi:alpha-galactosidase